MTYLPYLQPQRALSARPIVTQANSNPNPRTSQALHGPQLAQVNEGSWPPTHRSCILYAVGQSSSQGLEHIECSRGSGVEPIVARPKGDSETTKRLWQPIIGTVGHVQRQCYAGHQQVSRYIILETRRDNTPTSSTNSQS